MASELTPHGQQWKVSWGGGGGAHDTAMPGIVDDIRDLSRNAQNSVANLVLTTLTLHVHVSEQMRDKIWAGEFVDMHALLLENSLD